MTPVVVEEQELVAQAELEEQAEHEDEAEHEDDEHEEELEVELYGELNAQWLQVGGDNPYMGDATLRRLTLEVEKEVGDFEVKAELEWENAIACDGCGGVVEVEQGFVTWNAPRGLALDAGLFLVPFGMLNLHHEPGDFLGVERPSVDQRIVPTTWRELGVGVRTAGPVRVRAALVTAPDPTRLGPNGLAGSSSFGSHARLDTVALASRLEVQATENWLVAVQGYGSNLGPNGDFFSAEGDRLHLFLPLAGAGLDTTATLGAFTLRAEAAVFLFPEAETLMAARREDGSPWFGDDLAEVVRTRWQGAYLEPSVDVLEALGLGDQRGVVFARAEIYDGTAAVPEGRERDPAKNVTEWTLGTEWWPVEQVGLKADVTLRDRELGLDERQVDAGLAWLF